MYYNEVDPLSVTSPMIWKGPSELAIGEAGRGPRPIANLSSIALIANQGIRQQGSCELAIVYQDESGLLNLWGYNCNGTGTPYYATYGRSIKDGKGVVGGVIPTFVDPKDL